MRPKCNAAQTNFIKEDFVKSKPNWKILILYPNNNLKWGVPLSPAFPFMSYFFQFNKANCFFLYKNQKRHFKEHNGRDGQWVADVTKHLLYESVFSSLTSLLCTWNTRQQQSDLLLDFIDLLSIVPIWKLHENEINMVIWTHGEMGYPF